MDLALEMLHNKQGNLHYSYFFLIIKRLCTDMESGIMRQSGFRAGQHIFSINVKVLLNPPRRYSLTIHSGGEALLGVGTLTFCVINNSVCVNT
jgi:hypothetical protein